MRLYFCSCLNCSYKTTCILPINIARQAVRIHKVKHIISTVEIRNEQNIIVESYG
jgi:hypothetical protein